MYINFKTQSRQILRCVFLPYFEKYAYNEEIKQGG